MICCVKLNALLGERIELVGDDVFCTNPKLIARGIDENIANAVLIKLNQIGTVTETIQAVEMALEHGWGAFVSHRSGETIDSFVADLTVGPVLQNDSMMTLGEPLIFKLLSFWTFGSLPEGHDVFLHPIAFAGWVGIFITALNLIPISQLDGGHVLYALLGKRSHQVAIALLVSAALAVVLLGYWGWTLMILLLLFIGPKHPPTANDNMPLGVRRTVLGWLSLLFVVVGFTPTPFVF